jgi:hypothetical protein
MAIKLADVIENANAAYPVINPGHSNIKGLHLLTDAQDISDITSGAQTAGGGLIVTEEGIGKLYVKKAASSYADLATWAQVPTTFSDFALVSYKDQYNVTHTGGNALLLAPDETFDFCVYDSVDDVFKRLPQQEWLSARLDTTLYSKTSSTDFSVEGDIVKFGVGSTTAGELCFYKGSDGSWNNANGANIVMSGGVLLAIALGTDPDVDGMLLRGMFTLDHDPGAGLGGEIYVSTTLGDITGTAPSSPGDIVRVIGYSLDAADGQIWFNPSNDFIVLA